MTEAVNGVMGKWTSMPDGNDIIAGSDMIRVSADGIPVYPKMNMFELALIGPSQMKVLQDHNLMMFITMGMAKNGKMQYRSFLASGGSSQAVIWQKTRKYMQDRIAALKGMEH